MARWMRMMRMVTREDIHYHRSCRPPQRHAEPNGQPWWASGTGPGCRRGARPSRPRCGPSGQRTAHAAAKERGKAIRRGREILHGAWSGHGARWSHGRGFRNGKGFPSGRGFPNGNEARFPRVVGARWLIVLNNNKGSLFASILRLLHYIGHPYLNRDSCLCSLSELWVFK